MNSDDLAARAKQKLDEAKEASRIAQENVEHFRDGVRQLLDNITAWIQPFIANGSGKAHRDVITLNDDTAKQRYEIESGVFEIANRRLIVQPEWLYGVGMSAAVEIKGFKSPLTVFKHDLNGGQWLTRRDHKSLATVEFNEAEFMSRLEKIL